MTVQDPKDEILTHIPSLRAFALSLTRNSAAADDLVQDTLVKGWSNLSRYQVGSNMRAWLFTILRNTYYSDRRKSVSEITYEDASDRTELSVGPDHDGRLAMDEFHVAFSKLPDDQREALSLVAVAGFTYEEAAETCGVATGTMKSRVNRARKQLSISLDLEATD